MGKTVSIEMGEIASAIIDMEKEIDYYKRLSEAADEAIEALIDTAEELGVDLSGVSEYEVYQSIIKEREK
jgi:uncharacterized protein YbjQ (UPF0145 family)